MPFLAITAGLVFIFASYTSADYLADAAQGRFAVDTVLQLVGLKIVIALEVLLPIGLYLALIFGLGRLYRDREMIALQAGGLTRARMLTPLVRISVLIALIVGAISLFGRPWAYGRIYALETTAEAQMNIASIQPGRFRTSGDGRLAVLAQGVHPDEHRLEGVFVTLDEGGHRLVIRAKRMTQTPQPDGPPVLTFHEGRFYRLDKTGRADQTLHFGSLVWRPEASEEVVGYKRKAAPTRQLLTSTDTDDIAERQWRLSRPLATVFLALLGIGFARSSPRRGRFGNAFAAAVTFALYYNTASIARTWVEHGSVPPLPGIYWLDALVGLLALALLFRPRLLHY